jgi:hypothetical protein
MKPTMLKSRANQLVVKATSAKGGRKSTDQLASLARQPKPIKRKVGFQSAETVRPSRAPRSGARLDVGSIKSQSGVDLTEKLRELLVERALIDPTVASAQRFYRVRRWKPGAVQNERCQ